MTIISHNFSQRPDLAWHAEVIGAVQIMAAVRIARDKASLDIFWLRDDSLADSDNLPPPDVIAQEIVEDVEAVLEQFRLIAGDLADAEAAKSQNA